MTVGQSCGSRSERGVRMGVFFVLLGLCLMLLGCDNSGSSGTVSAPPAATPQLEDAAVQELVRLYQRALIQEDIDRLQSLLHDHGGVFGHQTFLDFMSETFRRFTIIDLQPSEVVMQTVAEPFTVAFRETLSVIDPSPLQQRTRSVQTTWRLAKQTDGRGTVTILIAGGTQSGPAFELTTRGQIQAGVPVSLEVRETSGRFTPVSVEVEVPETGALTALRPERGRFMGSFVPPMQPHPQGLRIRIRGSQGQAIAFAHRYRLRMPAEGAVEAVAGTAGIQLFTAAAAPDGTIWTGGSAGLEGTLGRILQIDASGRTLLRDEHPSLEQLPEGAEARIEDMVIDQLGRVHALFIARAGAEAAGTSGGVVANGDLVRDPAHPNLLCQTVNVKAPSYPFQVQGQASASTRMQPADSGDIWLFGSDDGVARVSDAFREGQCPEVGVEVQYAPIFRREPSGLLSNTVPALLPSADGTLWFGTAFGLTRLHGGQFTALPFDPALSLRGDVSTLEAFFQAVAEAIFAARPVSTVALGGVSFVEAFGSPLVKEDLIFSLAEDAQRRLWVGTLGGGIRRIERESGTLRETLHLTREAGLASNIVFALAVGPDGSVWAAAEEGVSRIQEDDGTLTITHFSALDGLEVPVRDVTVGGDGAVWLATDGGLFRITETVGVVRGLVLDGFGRPVVGAEVRLLGTPYRTLTDAEGRFVLVNLPPGAYQLLIDGTLAIGGPLTAVVHDIAISADMQSVDPVELTPRPLATRLRIVSGDGQSGTVGQLLSAPLAVKVEDPGGLGIAGVPVAFTVIGGAGQLAAEVMVSDGQGIAANMLTPTRDGTVQVEATADGAAAIFTATASGPVGTARLVVVSGNNQVVATGEVLPEPLVVRLEDQFARPIPNVEVAGEIVEGDAVFVDSPNAPEGGESSTTVITDAEGRARFFLRAGSGQGEIRVRVSVPPLPEVTPVEFLATVGFSLPFGIAVEGDGNLVVIDASLMAVLRVDPHTGVRSVVSAARLGADPLLGDGPPFENPKDIAIEKDGRMVVVDAGSLSPPRLIRIDPTDGTRSILSDANVGDGPVFENPLGIAVEDDGNLVVVNVGGDHTARVLRIDPLTGHRSILSDDSTGSGPPFGYPISIAVEAAGNLVVLDAGALRAGTPRIWRVDPTTGQRTIVSDDTKGGGPSFGSPIGIAVEANGTLVVVESRAGLRAVLRVNPLSGDRTIISGCQVVPGPLENCPDEQLLGEGLSFEVPLDIAVELSGNFVVVDAGSGVVLRVLPATGERSVVSRPTSVGSGPSFQSPLGIAVEADGNLVVVEDGFFGRKAVVRVDPITGVRTIVSDTNRGEGPLLENPLTIATEPDGQLVVVDVAGLFPDLAPRIVRVDRFSGDRTIVSGAGTGRGPAFQSPSGIAVERDGFLVVADAGILLPPRILRIDPRTGDRTVVSGPLTGSGPLFENTFNIAVEAAGHLLVIDGFEPFVGRGLNALYRVDPRTGDRMIVSGCTQQPQSPDLCPGELIGTGPVFDRPTAIAVELDGTIVVVNSSLELVDSLMTVDPTTGERVVASGGAANVGTGPPFFDPAMVAIEASGDFVVTEWFGGLKAVMRVDPITGNRAIVSK